MCLKDQKDFSDRGVIMIGLAACLLAGCLVLDIYHVFFSDWNNTLWIIEYFGQSLKHGPFPLMINTRQLIGMPLPLFYAGKFYVWGGLISTFWGSAVAIRCLIFLALFLQFYQVYRAATKTGSGQKTAIGIAVMVTWAIYPLTNLYNRSDLTEFFAVAFLTCSAASLLCVVLQKKEQLATYDPIAVGLFFVVAAATHPLTGLFGGVILAILGAIVLVSCARERRLWFLAFFSITALLSLLALSPWLYMLHQFGNKIPINSPAWKVVSFRSEGFFPHSIDNILSRLSLFPLDLRAIQNGVQGVSGPYLDAQITMPLILFLACFIYIGIREKLIRRSFNRCEWSMMVGALLMLLITFTLSICPEISGWFGGFFDILQFPYRLATFVNLSALILLIPIAGRISRVQVNSRQIINICLAVCIAVSFSALILKLIHASVVMSRSTEKKGWVMDKLQDGMLWAPNPGGSSRHLNEMPGTFTAGGVYFVEDGFSTVVSAGAIPVIRGDFNVLDQDRIGDVEPLVVNLPQLTLVITNVQPFPWNHIFVDGSAQQPSRRLLAAGRQSVLLPPGRHRLDFVASIDGTWKALDVLSWLLLTGWMALCLRWAFVKKNFVDVDPGGRDAAV